MNHRCSGDKEYKVPSLTFPSKSRPLLGLVLTLLLLSNAAPPPTTAFAREPAGGPAPAFADTHYVRRVPVGARDVVYSSLTGKLYASLPSRAGATGNSVAIIDPTTGAVEGQIFVGSEPGKLALADDGRTLYVGLDGAAAVRRLDVVTQTAGTQFALGEDNFDGPLYVKDMAVAPGAPHLLAVSRKVFNTSPDFKGVALYDESVRLPSATPGHTGSDNIDFSDSASVLYGVGGFGGMQKMSVTPSGLSVVNSANLSGGGGEFKFEGGALYQPFGSVYDAATAALLGKFTLPPTPSSPFPASFGAVEPDVAAGRVYILSGESAYSDFEVRTLVLTAFDRQSFASVGSLQIPNVVGRVSSLIRWGANGLAFNSTGGQLFVIQTTLVPSNEPVPTPTPTPSPTPTPTATPSPTPLDLKEVAVAANDIVYDPSTQTAFASVPSTASAGANSITPFDPFSGAVGQPVGVGSEPSRLTITDDGQYIYMALNSAHAVLRFDVATRTPGLQFTLGKDIFDRSYDALDLAAAPGQPQTVAVVRGGNGTSNPGLAVYDDGVSRSYTTGSSHTINVIEYSPSPLVLYGLNTYDTESGFRKVALPPCGPSVMSVKRSLIGGTRFDVENGVAYSNFGRAADAETGTVVGTFPIREGVSDSISDSAVLADAKTGRVYFFMHAPTHSGGTPSPMLVRAYDMSTFLHVGTVVVPNIVGTPTRVFRYGADGFAVRTHLGKVYLLRTDLIPAVGQPVAPAPTPTPPSYTLRGQVSVFNGPLPPPVTMSLSGPLTGTTTTNPDGTFAFTRLPFCADFTVTPQPLENYTFNPASVTLLASNQNSPNFASAFFNGVPKLLSFAQSSVSVSEGAGSVTVNVTRTGNLSAPATVFYQTNDNTASERADYTAALGTVSFAANETTKPLKVFVTDDARAEAAESFTISLTSPSGALLGTLQTVTVSISDNDAADGTTNPADNAAFFVRQHYLDFLNREPDPEGFTFWTNEITGCGTNQQCVEVKRINVSAAFFLSIEFQETGYLAYRMHKAAYGDATSPNVEGTVPVVRLREFLADARRIGQGVQVNVGNWQAQLDANKAAYVLEFVQRQRFKDAYPSDLSAEAFVERLDQKAGGILSAEERTQHIASLGATPGDDAKRAAVLRAVAEDADLRRAELNRAFVLMQYYGYLRRNPDDPQDTNFEGWMFWLGKLNEFNGDYIAAEMVKAFISSIEYRKRFGQ